MKKWLLSTLLALCMVLALLPETAWAEETSGSCGDNLTWSYNDGVLTIQGTGQMDDYSVFEAPWYAYHEQIRAVTIGDGVTNIGESAFSHCSSMTGVTISDSVTSIGFGAFEFCSSMTSVTIPTSVTSIGGAAFFECSSLTSVTLPDSITCLDGAIFRCCSNLTSVTIPSSVTYLDGAVFRDCTGLTTITIPDGVTSIGAVTFNNCSNLTNVTIPTSVTSIGWHAFDFCSRLTDIYYAGSKNDWASIEIDNSDSGNDPLLNASIHYDSIDSMQEELDPNGENPGEEYDSEYIYNTTAPNANTKLDANRLNSVINPISAVEAVRDMVSGMTQEQKESPTGIDLATLYAEAAVAKAASKPVTGSDILINAANIADAAAEAAQTLSTVEDALANNGITTARYLSKTVTLTTSETDITIRIDPDILRTEVDKVRVETPDYALTFKLSDLVPDLTGILTFKAAPTNIEILSVKNAVNIEMPGGSMADPITVSLPTDKSTDTTYQAVVSSTGTTAASKYNPATTDIDGKVNASGTYTVETNEMDFTDITNKSAEMQQAIKYLAAHGIIMGSGGTNYSPNDSISRAELTALVLRALGKVDSKTTTSFTDVTPANWYYSTAASSQELGYITGFEDNTFWGTTTINKEQIVVVAARVLGGEMNYKTPSNTAAYLSKYSDTVVSWAQPQVALATRENLVVYRTDGTFSGAKNMTRGDAAIIIYRLFQRIW